MEYFGNKISGKKGLKALIEEKYHQEDKEVIKPVEHISKKNIEDTFKSLKDMSQYHPSKSIRKSLLQRIKALLDRIMGKKK
jgi:ribosomal protein S8